MTTGRPAAIASTGVSPKVSCTLSDSEVKKSAADHAWQRTCASRPSTMWTGTSGQTSRARASICLRSASDSNHPVRIRWTRLPVARWAACRPMNIGSGWALAVADRRPRNSAAMESLEMLFCCRKLMPDSSSVTKERASIPRGMIGSCRRAGCSGRVLRRAPRYSCQRSSSPSTMSWTARDVQITASQLCSGAVAKVPMASITVSLAVVWVMPHRLHARWSWRRRSQA